MRTDYFARARSFVGTAFRPQGRDPGLGLDCVGLALAVYELRDVYPRDYRLAGEHWGDLKAHLARGFRRIAEARLRPGDLCVWQVAKDQLHLGIQGTESFVHADARLRRVVETPSSGPWPLVAIYRRRVRPNEKV